MKRIVCSLLAGCMLLGAIPAMAADINITIDGEEFIPKNALGEVVEPFIENGSTFLPVRAMGEAVGKEVSFDSENNAVYIGEVPAPTDVTREPVVLIGDRVFYEDEQTLFSNFALVASVLKLAEERFTREDIDLRKGEIKANLDWNTAWLISGDEIKLDSYAEYMACVNLLLESVDIEEAYADFVSAKHIMVTDAAVAEEIVAKIESGADFDTLIEEYNTDPGQTKDSVYTFTFGEMVAEFEEAAYKLSENEFTKEPVKTQFGYHIIKRVPLVKDDVDEAYAIEMHLARECEKVDLGKIVRVTREGDYAIIDGRVYTVDEIKTIESIVAGISKDEITNLNEAFNDVVVVTAFNKLARNIGLLEDENRGEFDAEYEAGVFMMLAETFMSMRATEDVDVMKVYESMEKRILPSLKVFVDGKLIVPGDVNNNYVAPKNVNGTVYVPVRAIVEALGMSADWDNDTRTVVITK
ncbi:MAG: peptidylprolyl isomerase [Clostridia bacterium]|nr:peptidylprolyl isomerase [Clostridia bacterium]